MPPVCPEFDDFAVDEPVDHPGRPTDTGSIYTDPLANFALNTLKPKLDEAVTQSLDKFYSEENRLRREAEKHSVVDSNLYTSKVWTGTPKSVVEAWVAESAAFGIMMKIMTRHPYVKPNFTVDFEYRLTEDGLEMRTDVSCTAESCSGNSTLTAPLHSLKFVHKWPELGIEHDYSRLSRCLDRLMHHHKPVKERGNNQDLDVEQTIDKVREFISDTPIFGKLRDECYTPGRNGKAVSEIDANDTDREAQSRYTVESNMFSLAEGMSSKVVDMTYRGFVMEGDRTYGSWIKTPGIRLQLQSPPWDPKVYNIKNTMIYTQSQDDPL